MTLYRDQDIWKNMKYSLQEIIDLTSLSCGYRFTDTTNGFRSINYNLKTNYFKLKTKIGLLWVLFLYATPASRLL